MITHQSIPSGNSTRNEAYIYIFGGIKVKGTDPNAVDINDPNAEQDDLASSFEYMGDLWRYNLITDQWEDMEVYGIATVRRTLTLWNGQIRETTVPSDQKLKSDLPNMQKKRIKDLLPNEEIELPAPRGGHAACIIGNPPDYMIIQGGSTEEILDESDSNVRKLKKTLDDMWVYNTETLLWSRMFLNSESPPKRDNAIMSTAKSDRLLILYGG